VRHQALHDSLTGLPNRALILDRVEQLLVSRGPGARRTPAVLIIDLDGFKEVNDTFGHAAGDQLLLTFARRLRLAVRAQDTVGRLGGDEFVVLLEDAESVLPQEVAERLLAAARDPFTIDEVTTGELSVTASIGIATGEREEAGQLLRDADVALYNAKAAGKNRFAMFRAQMQLSVHDRVLLQMEVQEAVELGQFSLVLQPRRDLASNRTVAVQAWPRWQHPQRGVLDAEEFGPLVQDGTVAIHIGRWLLSHACDQVTRWHQDGIDLDLAIAVASAHLHDESFLDDVHQTLAASGLKPEQLVVEISERAMLGEQTMIAARLGVLHDLGIRISVNGFGIAAFPLASLSSLPIGLLKIEKIFLQDPGAGERPPDLARPLIHLAKALGLMAIADGIAHPAQRDRLRLEGCTYGQGPLFGARMDPRSLEALVRQESARQPQVPGQPQKPGQPR
jgi:diguanylate cyclase (GGDEF)-like protein